MQAHMLGQVSGHVSNQVQASGQLQGMNQRSNGNAPSYPMQNHGVGAAIVGNGAPATTLSMDPDFIQARRNMQQKIFAFLLRKQPQNLPQLQRLKDIVKRLEEGLFKSAVSKEDYLNMDTMEQRLHSLIKRTPQMNRQQTTSSSSSATTTMIPTPGMSHGGSSNAAVTSSMDASTAANSETHLSAVNVANGSLSNGYQQAPTNSNFSVGNNSASFNMQRMNSQMIPTPGFNSSGNSTSFMNVEGSNNGGRYSTAESAVVAQQNVLVPQQKSNGFSNGAMNGVPGTSMNNILADSVSPKASLHRFDQYQQGTAVGSMMNSQNTSSVLRANTSLVSSHLNLPNSQQNVPSLQRQLSQPQNHHYQQQQRFFNGQHMQQNQQQQQQFTQAFTMSQVTPDLQGQIKHEPGGNQHDGILQTQTPEIMDFAQLHNQNDVHSSLSQGAPQMQKFIQPDQFIDSQSARMSSDVVSQGQWNPQSQDRNKSYEKHVKVEAGQRIYQHDVAQHNHGASNGNFTSGSTRGTPSFSNSVTKNGTSDRERQFNYQKRWLLFLRHARRCGAPKGKCQEAHCITVQELLRHMENCKSLDCVFPRCRHSKILIDHHKQCTDSGCPVCVPVKLFIQAQRKLQPRADSANSGDTGVNSAQMIMNSASMTGNLEELMPPQKRIKADLPSQSVNHEPEKPPVSMPRSVLLDPQVVSSQDQKQIETFKPVKKEVIEMRMENFSSFGQGRHNFGMMKGDDMSSMPVQRTDVASVKVTHKQSISIDNKSDEVKQESADQTAEATTSAKSGKPKVTGVSLTELFTPEQVREHIFGLRQWVGQSKSKAEKNQAMGHSMNENSCQLCAVERLTFEPPPLYCTPCGSRIKRNAMYYTVGAGDTRHCFCIPCYNDSRGDTIVADGSIIPKVRLQKKKNDEETEESWVQCDICEAWQHQICALFNVRRNDGGQAEYTCPNCYIDAVEQGKRKPLPQSAVLGAKDLPRTILSDHIEQRLGKKLKQERLERAKLQGKAFDEVPGADGLVVRVVSSVDKKLEVKQRFLEIFQEENYPTEFPYKSKVVLLFQKIEGVEVCLFGMYVQEFGSECQFPNRRRVYLSYLDSVKYFRPEVRAATGEALRTFVYHEILIGYLEYCKLRGFASCYIWACPPLKGEDYILYCHPEIQKTPKSDKLREWYLSMLKKAISEKIVVDLTNFYDHFFTSTGECKAKVTAARLPYFDGDYWPGAAEELIYQIRQEEEGKKPNKKGMIKKTITKRALKASGHDLSGNGSKDVLLMHKLGETISPMKEDFIMVHLQHPCSHCCILMVSGNRWVCSACRNFQICDRCYELEQKREDRERHPMYHREVHRLDPVPIDDIPEDTKDRDDILESEFFDTRQAFLSLCQGNHYQYDTLRRAKHSSMMVLYHLHNPTAPAFVTMCHVCHLDIEAGQGWRCEVCPDYEVCNNCYKKDGGVDHPHKLTNNPSTADRDAQNKEARQLRVSQLRKMLDLLVHASQCRSASCQYPNCRKVKGLFKHGIHCKTRASGGCPLCKKMWYLLQLHSRACKESGCNVPRCRDLKEHLRRLQQQADTRRRAAVMEMMRQRAAEVAGGAG